MFHSPPLTLLKKTSKCIFGHLSSNTSHTVSTTCIQINIMQYPENSKKENMAKKQLKYNL